MILSSRSPCCSPLTLVKLRIVFHSSSNEPIGFHVYTCKSRKVRNMILMFQTLIRTGEDLCRPICSHFPFRTSLLSLPPFSAPSPWSLLLTDVLLLLLFAPFPLSRLQTPIRQLFMITFDLVRLSVNEHTSVHRTTQVALAIRPNSPFSHEIWENPLIFAFCKVPANSASSDWTFRRHFHFLRVSDAQKCPLCPDPSVNSPLRYQVCHSDRQRLQRQFWWWSSHRSGAETAELHSAAGNHRQVAQRNRIQQVPDTE